jgi:RNA polymerase sigma factor (sigma-70 family)
MLETLTSHNFIQQLLSGDGPAAQELDRLYRQRLCAIVEREMDRCLRRREDPEDVVQSAMCTFFRHTAKGEIRIQRSSDLWQLLLKITRRKILKHARYHKAKKRHPKNEVYTETDQFSGRDLNMTESDLLEYVLETTLQEIETPLSEVFRLQLGGDSLAKIIQRALAGLESPYPEILLLRLHGCTKAQIADRLGYSYSAVRYKLERLRARLRHLLDGNAAA